MVYDILHSLVYQFDPVKNYALSTEAFNQSVDCSVDGKALLISADILYRDKYFILFISLLFFIYFFPSESSPSLALSTAMVFEHRLLRSVLGVQAVQAFSGAGSGVLETILA
jgi:hypothetical protein